MIVIHETTDIAELSGLQAALNEAGIHAIVLDSETSSIYGGALIARRLAVSDDDSDRARRIIAEALKQAGT